MQNDYAMEDRKQSRKNWYRFQNKMQNRYNFTEEQYQAKVINHLNRSKEGKALFERVRAQLPKRK